MTTPFARCSMTLAEVAGPLVEIQGGTKKKHFANLKEKTGIPYSEMLFFVRPSLNPTAASRRDYCPGSSRTSVCKGTCRRSFAPTTG